MHEQEPQPDHDINYLAMLNFTQPAVNNVVSAILLLLCWGGCHYSKSLTLTQQAIPFVHKHTFDLASNHSWKCSRLCRGNTVINSAVDTNNLRLRIVSVVCITQCARVTGKADDGLEQIFCICKTRTFVTVLSALLRGIRQTHAGVQVAE